MRTTSELIGTFMEQVEESTVISFACEFIKAYEGKNLPIPIKKIYFSFSGEENKVTYFTDEKGTKTETNDITVKINCFIPLSISPTIAHIFSETVALYIALSNEGITGFNVGETEYDSDVDAYRITSRIFYSSTEAVEL